MQYESPSGGAGVEGYGDPNPALGTQGSVVRAPAIENHQRELAHLIAFAGITASRADLTQVRQSIQVLINAAIATATLVEPGTLRVSASPNPGPGEFVCNGQAVSRTTYAALFTAIGTAWGAGNGTTTFNLPDLRGRALMAAGSGPSLTARTLGTLLGEETHQLTIAEIANHKHTYELHNGAGPNIKGDTVIRNAIEKDTGLIVGHPGAEGEAAPHNNIQPSAVVNVFIHQ